MVTSRRGFIETAVAGVCAPTIPLVPLPAGQTQEEAPPSDYLDQSVIDFWVKAVSAGANRSEAKIPDPTKTPEYLIYTDEHKAFRTIAEIQDSELLSSGDATVSLFVNQFRCSEEDISKTKNLKAATMRINVQQQKPLVPVLGVLAYPIMAAIYSKNAKSMPALTAPSVDTGVKLQYVPLPGGSAKWNWNVFAQHEQSLLGKFIQFVLKEANQVVPIIAPLMSFPAVTKPAVQAINALWGYWQAKAPSHWLFNDVQTDVYATVESKAFFDPKSSVPLVKGRSTYVLIPQVYLPQFKKSQNDLVVMQGYVVPRKTDPKDVHTAALQAIPDVTYVTVSVNIFPGIVTGPGASAPAAPEKNPS
jgi:hypothetical protein